MSVDFPNEAARCQRFLSGRAQSNFEPAAKPDLSLAATEVISVARRSDIPHSARARSERMGFAHKGINLGVKRCRLTSR